MAFMSFAFLYAVIGLILFTLVAWQVSSVVIAVYIFRDAQKREMNAGKWVWLSLLNLVGFIIYIARRKDLIRSKCSACGFGIKNGWKFCPECASPIVGSDKNIAPKQKKTPLKAAIAFHIIFPAVLLACVVGGVTLTSEPIEYFSTESFEKEEFLIYNPDVSQWVKECDEDKKHSVFVLYNEEKGEAIIYTKGWIGEGAEPKLSGKSNFFRITELNIELPQGEFIVSDGYNITVVRDVWDGFECIEAYSGDKQIEIKFEKTDKSFL